MGEIGFAAIKALLLTALFLLPLPAFASDWKGVDDTVVGKVAAEHGREARPLFGLSGDAQLFAFLIAGAAGGFVMGYYFRDFTGKRK